MKFKCHFSWQEHSLFGEVQASQVHYLVKFKCHFSWQAQSSVKLKCHFSWQVQHCVKFEMIAGAQNVVFFNRKCSWRALKVTSVARRVMRSDGFILGSCSDHSQIMLGSCSDRSRIVNDVTSVLEKFLSNFRE